MSTGRQSDVEEILPLLGLRIAAGPIELRGVTDDLLGPLVELALDGIHGSDEMPFYVPWSVAPPDELPRNFAQYHWRTRAEWSVSQWTMELAVLFEGEPVGVQGFNTRDYLVTRTGETGSWLGRRHQGRGIGTAMRQVLCTFIFDHLAADHITSVAFDDNPVSLAVSRRVGYRESGWKRIARQGKPAKQWELTLMPEDLTRSEHELTVEGLEPFRRSIGLSPQVGR